MKKTLSIFLAVVMVMSVMGIPAVFAATVTPEYDEVYTELYRMDFDDIATVEATTDHTAFNDVYGSTAKLRTDNASVFNYTVAPKVAGSADKYIQLDTDYVSTDGHSAIEVTLPDGGFKANNGTYKISYDVKWNRQARKSKREDLTRRRKSILRCQEANSAPRSRPRSSEHPNSEAPRVCQQTAKRSSPQKQ